jgi:methylenetetrahydrofolate--tRNA-(uracil-5-)-methyltransferase
VLLAELEKMGSLLVQSARMNEIPAGGALAVDRSGFANWVTQKLENHPQIEIRREEVMDIPDGVVVIATGPLTSERMSQALTDLSGEDQLYFFDAISPIVEAETINFELAYRGSRYGRGTLPEGDYINCPMSEAEYDAFLGALLEAERIPLREFEEAIQEGVKAGMHSFFEGCLPVEVIAERGKLSLAYGPLRPVGLIDPRSGKRPFAVVQLRQDDLRGSLYNMVGFQTNLKFPEQRRVFRMIPGLEKARFHRYGQMHRNTFLNAPLVLSPSLKVKSHPELFIAGQLTGVEGYLGNIATGLLAGVNAAHAVQGRESVILPPTTMLGALCHYITSTDPKTFQPMKANLGILAPLEGKQRKNRRERAAAYAARSQEVMSTIWTFDP